MNGIFLTVALFLTVPTEHGCSDLASSEPGFQRSSIVALLWALARQDAQFDHGIALASSHGWRVEWISHR